MVTGKEDMVEAPEVTEPQEKTYSQEELDAALTEKEEAYKGLQKSIARQAEELGQLRKRATQPSSLSVKRDEIILEEMKRRAQEEGITNPRIAELEGELLREKQRESMETYTSTYREKLNQKIKESGLDPTDEQFDGVWETFDIAYAVDGKFERADKKLDRVLSKPKPEKKEIVVEKDDFTKRLEEEKRKWMEEQGLLATETGGPSASSPSKDNAYAKYVAGDITVEEAKRAGVEFL